MTMIDKRLALCIGRNKYTTSPLLGCVNDADDVANVCELGGFKIFQLLDEKVTVNNAKDILKDLADSTRVGHNRVFISNSSHGTQYYDYSGDEIINGVRDVYDEALYWDRVWIDDDICVTLQQFNPDTVDLGLLLDSCHSDTATRDGIIGLNRLGLVTVDHYLKPRFIRTCDIPPQARRRRKQIVRMTEEDMFWWVYAGCGAEEYSFDAVFNGRPNGAMTYFWKKAVKLERIHEVVYHYIRQNLPSTRHPQTPTLEGRFEGRCLIDIQTPGEIIPPRPSLLQRIVGWLVWLWNKIFRR